MDQFEKAETATKCEEEMKRNQWLKKRKFVGRMKLSYKAGKKSRVDLSYVF